MTEFPKTLRGRLTVWYCGALTIFLTLFGPALYGLVRHHLAHHHDPSLRIEASTVLKVLGEHEDCLNLSPQQQEALNSIGRLMVIHEVEGQRHPFFQSAELSSQPVLANLTRRVTEIPPEESFETFENEGRLWRVISVPYQSHVGRKGVVRLMVEMGDITETLEALRLSLWVLTVFGILLSWTGGYWISGRALQPIHTLADRAQAIEASNLSQRLPHPGVDSEIGRLVDTLNRAFERLEASFASMRRFTADASHELRNPLATLQNTIDVTLEQPRTSEEHVRVLASLGEEVNRLRLLVNDLLLLARADAGAVKLRRDPLSLDQLVGIQVNAHQTQAEAKGIALAFESQSPVEFEGDERWLHQLLGNLLDNALKFTAEGGRVRVSLADDPEWIRLTVRDTGPGIPTEDLSRIFDRFFRSDPSRSQFSVPGIGLGLSIAGWIAKMHGGEIQVSNHPEGGAVFLVLLPRPAAGH